MKMNVETTAWARRYRIALRRFLRHGPAASPSAAERLGSQAAALGLETLAVASIHVKALHMLIPQDGSPGIAKQEEIARANTFFKETIVPIEASHRAACNCDRCIDKLTRTLRQLAAESSASAEHLKRETARRQAAEAIAEERAGRHDELLAEAQRMQTHLRHRMRGILSQNESERQRIGGELRDEIAQALLAIDISLLALGTSGRVSSGKTEEIIVKAQHDLLEFTNLVGKKIGVP